MRNHKSKNKHFYMQIILILFIVLWTIFIWSRSLKSGIASSADSDAVADSVISILGKDSRPEWFTFLIRKIGHFSEFAILGILWGCLGHLRYLPFMFIYGLPIGIIDECLQFLSPGRSPMIMDAFIDYAGYLFGFYLVYFVLRFLLKKKVDNTKSI